MTEEIERKFLVNELPPIQENYPVMTLVQGYLPLEGNQNSLELRVRKRLKDEEETYFLSTKSGKGLQRSETEIIVPKNVYDLLFPLTEGRRIEKMRYLILYGEEDTIELDVYSGSLEGLIVAEVEFGSVEESKTFVIPSWFGEEVTQDSGYKNKNLAIKGLPK